MKRLWMLAFVSGLGAILCAAACSDNVTSGAGGAGGAGGADSCSLSGPNGTGDCSQEGKQCFYADTSCQYTWTCESGEWKQSDMCFSPPTGNGGSAGGTAGGGGMAGGGGSGGTAGGGP